MTVDRNETALLAFGTHYKELTPTPRDLRCRLRMINFEGVRRCVFCFCFTSEIENHQLRCKGKLPGRFGHFPCHHNCGLRFTSKPGAASHSRRCLRRPIRVDRYNALKCPHCHVDGFNVRTVTSHGNMCNGQRHAIITSYGGGNPSYTCPDCKHIFLRNGLESHTCHVVGDAVWLGKQSGPPDIKATYISWCRSHNLTLGGVPGQMPSCVPDLTVTPASEHTPVTVLEDEPTTSSDLEQIAGRSGQRDDEGQDVLKSDIETRLSKAGITFDSFLKTPCQGVIWRHGYFPCPFSEVLSLDNVVVTNRKSVEGKVVPKLAPYCRGCLRLAGRIKQWVFEGKFTIDGVQLCRQGGCRKAVAAFKHCREHADLITRRHISHSLRNDLRRTITSQDLNHLLAEIRGAPPVLISDDWRDVRRAIRGGSARPSKPVFFIDTECVYHRGLRQNIVCEMTVRDASGAIIMATTVNHQLSYAELREDVDEKFHAKLLQIYEFDLDTARTGGLTPAQAAARLVRAGLGANAHIVEWSTNSFDLRALRHLFAHIGDVGLPQRSLLGHHLWKALGVSGSLALFPFFATLFPDSDLAGTHHRASLDSLKLYHVVCFALDQFAQEESEP